MAHSTQNPDINQCLPAYNEKSEPPRCGSEIYGEETDLTCTCGGVVVVDDKIGTITAAHGVLPGYILDRLDFNTIVYPYPSCPVIRVYHPAPTSLESSFLGTVTRACFRSGSSNEVSIDAAFIELSDQSQVPLDGYMTRQTQERLHKTGMHCIL